MKCLDISSRTCSYTSATAQNEMISTIQYTILEKIVKEINSSVFSIICDETTDITEYLGTVPKSSNQQRTEKYY